MIELTKLNGSPMVLNSDLIKTAEASPDTMLTLVNGEKLIVRESIDSIVEAVVAYRTRLLAAVAQRVPEMGALTRLASSLSLNAVQHAGESARSVGSSSSRGTD